MLMVNVFETEQFHFFSLMQKTLISFLSSKFQANVGASFNFATSRLLDMIQY